MRNFLKIKKISAVIICAAIVAMLCACQNTDTVSSPDATSSDSTAASALSTSTQAQNSSEDSGSSAVSSTASKPSASSAVSKPATSSKTTSSSTPQTSTAEKTPAQIILGKWRGSIDIAALLAEEDMIVEGEHIVSCDVEYISGGVIYEVIDRTSLKAAYTNIFNQMINDTLTQQNLTKEQFETQAGMTIEEYLAQTVQLAMDMVPTTVISTYKFEGNDLYIRDQDDTDYVKTQYSFNGENKLTIVEDGVSVTYTRIG